MTASRKASARSARLLGSAALATALVLTLTACGSAEPAPATPKPTTAPSETSTPKPTTEPTAEPEASGDVVPGFGYGEIPPIPLFALPSLALLDNSLGGFSVTVAEALPSAPGLTIAPAACGDPVVRANAAGSMILNGDGSGVTDNGDGLTVNNGDGSGTYTSPTLSIINNGDGTSLVNGTQTDMEPLAGAVPVGAFPALGSIAPIEYCGTTITLEDRVLFDFDKSDLRPEAATTIAALATVLKDLKVPAAEIGGHTDSIGSDDYNQDLSERRAQPVVDALVAAGVPSTLTAVGYGETAPSPPTRSMVKTTRRGAS